MKITMQNSIGVSKNYAYKNNKKTGGFPSLAATSAVSTSRIQNIMPSNYAQSLISSKQVSFGENLPVPVGTSPLEKKVGGLIPYMEKNDIILVGPNLKTSSAALKSCVDKLEDVVSSVYSVEDSEIKTSFLLRLSEKNLVEIMNLDVKSVSVLSKGKHYTVKKGDATFLTEGDRVKIDNRYYEFSEDYSLASVVDRMPGVKKFDFSAKDQSLKSKLNSKHIDQIYYEEEPDKAPKKITFADVGGQDKAIMELKKSIVYPLKYPSAYKNNILNHGVVLAGGPGTGKTLLAQALANETDAFYLQLNGLEMESKWVGASEENWRNLFQTAKDNQPSIIFIDEFDAVARNREGSSTSRYDDKVVNQLLTLMSDLEKSKDEVYVVVATNRLNLLDDAILRSGRFGKHIQVDNPNLEGCKKILEIHSKGKPVAESFDADSFANDLYGAKVNGADIAHIVNEANANAFDRLGVYEKMENDSFTEDDIQNLKVESEDFYKALDEFKEQSKLSETEKPKRRIGFINEDTVSKQKTQEYATTA